MMHAAPMHALDVKHQQPCNPIACLSRASPCLTVATMNSDTPLKGGLTVEEVESMPRRHLFCKAGPKLYHQP
jgi:hypothetical protein